MHPDFSLQSLDAGPLMSIAKAALARVITGMNKRTTTLVRYGLLFFAVFFSLVALAQYLFVRSQLDRTISVELRRSANAIRRAIAYKDKWELAGFRRWLVDAPQNYVVMASNGL